MIRVCGVLRVAGRGAAAVSPYGAGALCLARAASTVSNKMFPRDMFASRHIGPRDYEQREMLDFLGYKVSLCLSRAPVSAPVSAPVAVTTPPPRTDNLPNYLYDPCSLWTSSPTRLCPKTSSSTQNWTSVNL